MTIELNLKIEKGVRLLARHMPISKETSRKPGLFHGIRVGVYLYEREYVQDIVLAGLLHDALEWSSATQELLKQEFGDNVLRLVMASTKDDTIIDKFEKTKELIQRCIANGEEALIVKAADILDSFKWYASQENIGELKYCLRNANAIFEYKPDEFDDKIFIELKSWRDRFSSLAE